MGVSNPAAPREVGARDTPGWARGVTVAGNHAYIADYDGGLVILRVSGAEQADGMAPADPAARRALQGTLVMQTFRATIFVAMRRVPLSKVMVVKFIQKSKGD